MLLTGYQSSNCKDIQSKPFEHIGRLRKEELMNMNRNTFLLGISLQFSQNYNSIKVRLRLVSTLD